MATPNSLSVNALFSVAGKVAVVTGGSRGIGEMIAAGLLANGAKVYISSRKAFYLLPHRPIKYPRSARHFVTGRPISHLAKHSTFCHTDP